MLLVMWVWIQAAVWVKRFHDLDYSGWWVLIMLVPVANIVCFLILGFAEGDRESNQYGPRLR